jgi:eukaryotic-like serine/threonine-protein kinase
MSVPSSVEELLQLIRKSGMIDDQKLTGYLQRRQMGRGLPPDPREAADALVRDGLLTNFQSEQFLLGKWRGFTIGKYKLLERVGVGGMGQVFLCEHVFMKRRVAIKVLPPAKAEQPAALGRFYREARAAGSLEHPNIVRTHDIDQDGNLHFIVMEYVDGSNLLEIVKKQGAMEIGRAVSYISQCAAGLEFAFKNGLIHRDVKPGNILIDRRGKARILDMGLARFYKDQNDLLTVKYDDKIVLGTADYVAPEQVANSHAVDVRADVYGLGATFYFLLAGHPPFPAGTVSQKLLWHRTKDPTPIRQIRAEVPEGLAQILASMMAKDPKNRYQTPGDVVAALAPWVPANVAIPTQDEMPQLCPAVTDGIETIDATPAPVELVEEPAGSRAFAAAAPAMAYAGAAAGRAPAAAGPAPFATPSSANRPSPFGSKPSGIAPPPAARQAPQNPFAPPPSNPYAAAPQPYGQDPYGAPADETAAPGRKSTFSNQAPFTVPVTDYDSGRIYKLALVAILSATAVIGLGMVYWNFLRTPPPAAVSK